MRKVLRGTEIVIDRQRVANVPGSCSLQEAIFAANFQQSPGLALDPTQNNTVITTGCTGGTAGANTIQHGYNATGTLTFTLHAPDDTTCVAAPEFTSAVTVAGDGTYQSSTFVPTAFGTHRWRASYGGDANNNAVTAPCNVFAETTFVENHIPTLDRFALVALALLLATFGIGAARRRR